MRLAAGQSWADPAAQSREGASAKKTLKSSVSVMVYNKYPLFRARYVTVRQRSGSRDEQS